MRKTKPITLTYQQAKLVKHILNLHTRHVGAVKRRMITEVVIKIDEAAPIKKVKDDNFEWVESGDL